MNLFLKSLLGSKMLGSYLKITVSTWDSQDELSCKQTQRLGHTHFLGKKAEKPNFSLILANLLVNFEKEWSCSRFYSNEQSCSPKSDLQFGNKKKIILVGLFLTNRRAPSTATTWIFIFQFLDFFGSDLYWGQSWT